MPGKLKLPPIDKRFIAVFGAMIVGLGQMSTEAQETLRERLQRRLAHGNQAGSQNVEKYNIAGLSVAVWRPTQALSKLPLVFFSHGYHGSSTQSIFIMDALARAGYLVMAPNHEDAIGEGSVMTRPAVRFRDAARWNESSFKKRGDDIKKLIDALHQDKTWDAQIDWSEVALAGHSLGGYTVLALGGGWPSWKLPGIKAILALSPYCEPFTIKGDLGGMHIPVMYQGGTRDLGITPTIKKAGGAYSKTSSPAYFVEFDKVGHFSWTNFNHDQATEGLISSYCVAFLDKYLKRKANASLEMKLPGVETLSVK